MRITERELKMIIRRRRIRRIIKSEPIQELIGIIYIIIGCMILMQIAYMAGY